MINAVNGLAGTPSNSPLNPSQSSQPSQPVTAMRGTPGANPAPQIGLGAATFGGDSAVGGAGSVPVNKKKRKISLKWILVAIIGIILVAGLGVGLYLQGTATNILPKAAGTCQSSTSHDCSITCGDGTHFADACPYTFANCGAWATQACNGHQASTSGGSTGGGAKRGCDNGVPDGGTACNHEGDTNQYVCQDGTYVPQACGSGTTCQGTSCKTNAGSGGSTGGTSCDSTSTTAPACQGKTVGLNVGVCTCQRSSGTACGCVANGNNCSYAGQTIPSGEHRCVGLSAVSCNNGTVSTDNCGTAGCNTPTGQCAQAAASCTYSGQVMSVDSRRCISNNSVFCSTNGQTSATDCGTAGCNISTSLCNAAASACTYQGTSIPLNTKKCVGTQSVLCSATGQITNNSCGAPGCNTSTGLCNAGTSGQTCTYANQNIPSNTTQCIGLSSVTCGINGVLSSVTDCGTAGCNGTTKQCNAPAAKCSYAGQDLNINTRSCIGLSSVFCSSSGQVAATDCGTAACNASTKLCNTPAATCSYANQTIPVDSRTCIGLSSVFCSNNGTPAATNCGLAGCNATTHLCNPAGTRPSPTPTATPIVGGDSSSGAFCPNSDHLSDAVTSYKKYVCSSCYRGADGHGHCDTLVDQSATNALHLDAGQCGQVDQFTGAQGNTYCGYAASDYTCDQPQCLAQPSPSPSTPSGPQCLSIKMTNVSKNGSAVSGATDTGTVAAAPAIGDAVTFTCGVVNSGVNHYVFQVVSPDNHTTKLTATGATSTPYTISLSGKYVAQCQICTGAADSTCHAFETITP